MASLSIGEVAGSLGVAPSTVRMWGRRYGLTASDHTAGGHRRYTAEDVDGLRRMHAAVIAGTSPAAAAAAVTATGSHGGAGGAPGGAGGGPAGAGGGPGGPGGAVLAVPGAGPQARGLARAASRLDEAGATSAVLEGLRSWGTLRAWDDLLRPVLVAAGLHWERTGTGIEIEHLLTQAVTTAFSRYLSELPEVAQVRPVLLSGGPDEDHVLALLAARSALAERGVPARFLGPRTPMSVIASTARRTRTPGVLIWLTFPDPRAHEGLAAVRAAHRSLVVLVGGPGWAGLPVAPATSCPSLGGAVTLLEQSRGERPATAGRARSPRDAMTTKPAHVADWDDPA